jgi:hypothetical protein
LLQNSVSFGTSSWKIGKKLGFPIKFKEAVPKAEVLEQPQLSRILRRHYGEMIAKKWLSITRESFTP